MIRGPVGIAVPLRLVVQRIALVGIRAQIATSKVFESAKADVASGTMDVRSAARKVLSSLTFV